LIEVSSYHLSANISELLGHETLWCVMSSIIVVRSFLGEFKSQKSIQKHILY